MFSTDSVIFILIILFSIPIIFFDINKLEIPAILLILFWAGLFFVSWLFYPQNAFSHILAALCVLIFGFGILVFLPDRLGEADILYASAWALIASFPVFIFSFMLACLSGLLMFSFSYIKTKQSIPIAFTPLIFWGFLSIGLVNKGLLS